MFREAAARWGRAERVRDDRAERRRTSWNRGLCRRLCAQGAVDLRTEFSRRHAPPRRHCSGRRLCRGRPTHGCSAAERVGRVQGGAGSLLARSGRRGASGKPCGRRRVPASQGERSSGETHSRCGRTCGVGGRAGIRGGRAGHRRDPGMGAASRTPRGHRGAHSSARRTSRRRAGGRVHARSRRRPPRLRASGIAPRRGRTHLLPAPDPHVGHACPPGRMTPRRPTRGRRAGRGRGRVAGPGRRLSPCRSCRVPRGYRWCFGHGFATCDRK